MMNTNTFIKKATEMMANADWVHIKFHSYLNGTREWVFRSHPPHEFCQVAAVLTLRQGQAQLYMRWYSPTKGRTDQRSLERTGKNAATNTPIAHWVMAKVNALADQPGWVEVACLPVGTLNREWMYDPQPEPTEQEYNVRWEIEVTAKSPKEAAQQIWELYFKKDHTASILDVRLANDKHVAADVETFDMQEDA